MIPQSEFHKAFAVTLHAVPDDKPTMPALQSLLIEFLTDTEMRLVGTDGERIVVVSLELPHQQPIGSTFRMSPQGVREMLAMLPAYGGRDLEPIPHTERVTFCVFGDQFIATTDSGACVTVDRVTDLPDYPDYSKVMVYAPAPPDPRPFDRQFLAEAFTALGPLCETVSIHINGLKRLGYVDAVLSDEYQCITAVRIGISQRTV